MTDASVYLTKPFRLFLSHLNLIINLTPNDGEFLEKQKSKGLGKITDS